MNDLFDIDKRTEIFHQEMGKFIFYFDRSVDSHKYETPEKMVFYVLIKKIISNVTSANILILDKYINEAKIVLRSAIETVILIAYLSRFPEKIQDYIDDSQIIKLKNYFIEYKNRRDGEVGFDGKSYTKSELSQINKQVFNELGDSAKNKVLKALNIEDYIITEENLSIFDKFYKGKSLFTQFEKMSKELNNTDLIFDDEHKFTFRDLVHCFYNESSQVSHGCFIYWNKINVFDAYQAVYLFSFFTKTTIFLEMILKNTCGIKTLTCKKYLKEMKIVHLNLEKLVFGRVLEH